MAAATEKIKISLEFSDSGAAAVVKKLESSFRGLTNAANQLDSQGISKVRDRIKSFDTAGKRNISTIQSQIGALKSLRAEAQIGSTQFKQLTADIARYSQELQKAEGRKRTGGRLVGAAKSVGAVAAAGVFGGPEGAIGAGIGALAGGPVGAAVGGAVGAQVGQIRQALGGTAEYAANLQKLRIALEGVTTSQAEYAQGLGFIQKTTQDFAIPQEVVTRQFTKLQASVQGAGGNIDDTKTAFNGIVAAVRATGGSLADVDAALTATAQVFSKGKVSAEELRQQIGERLPGAFTLFAQSMGITPQELDKALEQGKVSLKDFQGFAKAIFDRYGENAKAIADSPAAAGDRLKVSLEKLQENIGTLLGPVGAAFQKTFEQIVNAINTGITALTNFLGIGTEGAINKAQRELDSALKGYERYQDLTEAEIKSLDNRQKNNRLRARSAVQTAIANLEAAKKNRSVVQVTQPTKGTGLPGAGDIDLPGTPKAPKAPKDISKEEADKQIAQLALRERGITLTEEQIQQAAELARKAAEALPPQLKRVELKNIEIDAANQINQLEQQQLRKANSIEKAKIELNKLLTKAKGEQGILNDEQLKQAENQIKVNELMLKFNILIQQGVLDADELREKIEKALKALNKPATEGMGKFKETFKEGIKSMGDIFGNLGRLAAQTFDGLGDKIHEFITTGKANFKEFAASVLSDLGKIFLKAAMFNILGTAFPGLKLFSAKGNAFASNGVVPFAKGGIVSKPTMFQYADGASGSFGLMGEAGAEAIMPLKRGPSGRLGVEVTNQGSARDAMNRYSRRNTAAAGSGMASEDEAIAAVQGSAAPIDVRYTVERINSVDYVTADQFQRGMQQAAANGAKQGEQRALTTLRQNTSQRRRIGLS
jgi:lambda family phage tail tape measure protein